MARTHKKTQDENQTEPKSVSDDDDSSPVQDSDCSKDSFDSEDSPVSSTSSSNSASKRAKLAKSRRKFWQ